MVQVWNMVVIVPIDEVGYIKVRIWKRSLLKKESWEYHHINGI